MIPEDTATLVIETADVPRDESPLPEYACTVCGVELTYSGRGRKPTKCDEHKRGSSGPRKTSTGNANALGKQAAMALAQINGLIATVCMVAPDPYRLPATASAIALANDAFEEAAANALSTDPKLAKLILRAGGASGKVALVIAYGMLAGAVVPVAITEYQDNVKGNHVSDRTGSA